MPVVAASNISHAFGDSIILEGCTLSIEAGERVGLVGRNGAGKSTLVKVMTGELVPDSGTVDTQRGARIGHLRQDPHFDPDESLRDAAEGAFAELHELHKRLHAIFDEMAVAEGEALEKLMKRQERLERDMEAAGGYAVDHKIDAVLHGLGFRDSQFGILTRDLSGGQRARLALAKLLLEGPDVLLLDEPTNHLDLQGRVWLETFLRDEYRGAVLMISHDRYLLDNVVTRIVEVEHGRTIEYPGNYAAFRRIRADRRTSQLRAYEKQQTKWKSEERFIQKYKAGQRAKQARGRETRLERVRRDTAIEKPLDAAELDLELPRAERSGDMVVVGRALAKSYENEDGSEKTLFNGLDITIGRGERWGIIGPNGAGKSTLVRCLLSEQEVDAGTIRLGSNVKTGHYRQSHEGMDPDLNVYRYLQKTVQKEGSGLLTEQQARNLAGAFLFSGEEQEKEMGVLSGGERSRAALAALLAQSKNLLVLDEPTNHLDIPSAERLEDALALEVHATSEREGRAGGAYEGTVILISHDRAIIDACCDHLIVLDGAGGAETFHGNYTAWREKDDARQRDRSAVASEAKRTAEEGEKKRRREEEERRTAERTKQGPSGNALERMKTDQLEKRIEEVERRVRTIDAEMGQGDVWRDAKKCAKLGDERARLLRELEPLEFEWGRRAEG